MRIMLLLLALLMCACRAEQAETISVSDPRIVTGTTSCTHPGYCMACGLGFDGSFKCAARFQYSCPGQRDAVLSVVEVKKRYPSEPTEAWIEKRATVIKTTGECR